MAMHDHHDHGDGHSHGRSGTGLSGSRALGTALLLTLGYAGVELVTGLWFGSLALVSDAGHMFSDAVALGLAWFAAWLGQRPAGLRHSFGLARAEVIAGFVNGLSMLLVVVLIVVEAIRRLLAPAPVAGLGVLVVAFLGLLLNLAAAFIISRGERDLNTRAALLHVMSDVLGSVIAMAAGAVIYFTGWTPIDPILSLFVAVLIVRSAWSLLRKSTLILMENAPDSVDLDALRKALPASVPGVRNVHDIHCWSLTSGQTMLTLHVALDRGAQPATVLRDAKQLLAERFDIAHSALQLEHEECPDEV